MRVVVEFLHTLALTARDVLPIAAILFGFQVFVLRRPVRRLRSVLVGFGLVLLGLALFLQGLEQALFPLGRMMAQQLTAPEFIYGIDGEAPVPLHWGDYLWVYAFAAAIGFATTIAEPSLIAVALKANQVSAGTVTVWGLRIAVAVGVAIGIALGAFRIVTGTPLHWYIITGYVVVVLQTLVAPRAIVPLAYDSGGVTTSTVTVPLVTALGLGLAEAIPGRSPLLDGFGLIAFASLFPIITVMGYAQIGAWVARRSRDSQGV
jgi:Na+/phosphate symporter